MRKLPEAEVLRELITHDPMTGEMWWKPRSAAYFQDTDRFPAQAQANIWNGKNAGKPAFARISAKGYRVGCIFGKFHLSHRVIWKMVTGNDPEVIDHINGDKLDNRVGNLRSTDAKGNATNQKTYATNRTGHNGVTVTAHGRYKAQIGNGGTTEYLGCFGTIEEAVAARADAERRLGYHENHGRNEHGVNGEL